MVCNDNDIINLHVFMCVVDEGLWCTGVSLSPWPAITRSQGGPGVMVSGPGAGYTTASERETQCSSCCAR